MIASCPKCKARYRIEREKLRSEGVRLRCARCQAIFRVRLPEPAASVPEEPPAASEPRVPAAPPVAAPAPGPQPAPFERSRGVLLAIPDASVAKDTAEALRERGLHAVVVHDGAHAMLEIQRKQPRAVVLAADLPKMFGFQVCEVVKRNESLRQTFVVLAGAIHERGRYRRPPGELYGADAYLELPDLPGGLLPLLRGAGLPLSPAGEVGMQEAAAVAPPPAAEAPSRTEGEPPSPSLPPPPPEPAQAGQDDADGLAEARAQAERLARIIVSDIILYNEEKFRRAVERGAVVEAMEEDLAEGRALFRERVDERVRGERDFLALELLRVARAHGAG